MQIATVPNLALVLVLMVYFFTDLHCNFAFVSSWEKLPVKRLYIGMGHALGVGDLEPHHQQDVLCQ